MKKWCIAFVCVAVLMVSPFLVAPVINNVRLISFAKQLYQTPTPPKTEVIETQSLCGRLGGTGNGMDYLAALLIRSDLSAAALAEYYEAQGYKPAVSGGPECFISVQVLRCSR